MPRVRPPLRALRAAAPLVTLGALTALVATPAAAATTTTQLSAQAEYEAAMKLVGNGGVHFSSDATQGGVHVQIQGDAGDKSGSETIVVHRGGTTEHMQAMVVGSTDYLKGNRVALRDVLGLSNAQVSTYAERWLSFPSSTTGLSGLVSGLLSSQVRGEIALNGPYRYATAATVAGRPALAIRGSVRDQNGTATPVFLYVPAAGTPLPIREVVNPGTGGGSSAVHETVSFSNWGEQPATQAPAHSVSLLKLLPRSGTSPQG